MLPSSILNLQPSTRSGRVHSTVPVMALMMWLALASPETLMGQGSPAIHDTGSSVTLYAQAGAAIQNAQGRSAVQNTQGNPAIFQESDVLTASYAMPEYVSVSSDSLLRYYTEVALQQSPALRAAFEEWLASRTMGDQLDRLPDPEIMFGYFLNPSSYDGVLGQATLGIMQMFPWPGTRAEARSYAGTMARAQREALESERIAIQQQVMTAWYALIALSRQEGYLDEHLEWVRRLQSVTQSRFENGYASRSDLIRLDIEEMEIEAEIRSARAALDGAKRGFNALLQRPHDHPVTLPEGRTDVEFRLDGIRVDSLTWTDHPLVRQAELRMEAAGTAERQAHLMGYPMIGVGAEAMGPNYLMGMDNNRVALVASVRVQVPVWRKPVRARIDQARAESRVASHRRDAVLQTLRSDLARAEAAYREADERVTLYQQHLLPRSRELTDLVLLDYSGGRSRLDDVISSRRLSVNYALALESALRDRNIAVAELLALFETTSSDDASPDP